MKPAFSLLSWILALALLCLPSLGHAGQQEVERALALLRSGDHADVARGITELAAADREKALTILSELEAGKLPGSSLNNLSRRVLQATLSKLRLTAENVEIRRAAAKRLAEYPDEESATLIRELVAKEKDTETRRAMALALAKIDIRSPDENRRVQAARAIVDSDDISQKALLSSLLQKNAQGEYGEPSPAVRAELQRALASIETRLFFINAISNTVYGLSLGSVLLLAALGLAITFGLMRVINMAHGEMLMLGAYSTYFVRERLLAVGPAAAEWYLALAIPFAFLTTFALGVLLERLVIRHLYGRPLETLLATWGLSLVLIQSVRVLFGAQNVTVANPAWLSGGFDLMPGLVVPYSRIAVLTFTVLVVGFVGFVLRGTSVGLKVRAVTQNREIAASLGIPTLRVDQWTFGLGSGLAGLGGVALSQLGNVGPELGQQHIIDSFVVVVVGGVGNILGTIFAAFGLGLANKILEPSVGAVLGKILLLLLLILFIQWRPQGLFALKGRAAES